MNFIKKINPTAVIVTILTIGFFWSQWPTKTGSKMPEQWHVQRDSELGYQIRFEQAPETETFETEDQVAQLFVTERKGINYMLQVIRPGTDNSAEWLNKSMETDQQSFGGKIVMDWTFQRQGIEIHEYVLSNKHRFVNQVRVLFTPEATYKLAVGFKEKDDSELLARVLTFLDSFELDQELVN